MNVVKVKQGELEVDSALPWSIYDENDRMLLNEGYIISSASTLDALLSRGVYREVNNKEKHSQNSIDDTFDETASPFILIADYTERLNSIFDDLEHTEEHAVERVYRLVDALQWFTERDREATLAAIHLSHNKKYSLMHPIHVALMCEVVASRMNIANDRRRSLLAAALTSNISIRNFQEMLQRQNSPLTEQQRQQIHDHPERSARILGIAGVEDDTWLTIVLQHHEQLDGNGYPHGMVGDDVIQEARLLTIVDRYTAMISKRAYREPFLIQDALREFFMEKGNAFDELLCLQIIKELGVYPPGAFVKLKNGEIAIVVKRSPGKSTTPTVKSIIGFDGSHYANPLIRETVDPSYMITEVTNFQPSMPLNLDKIWGYA